MSDIIYTSTAMTPSGKSGKMRPDANGYFDVVLGGLNIFNSAGEFYALEGSDQQFRSSSSFMRNVTEGTLYAEYGHPKRPPGMTDEDWTRRYVSLDSDRFTGHIGSVSLDSTLWKKINDPRLPKGSVVIMGKIMPDGPMKEEMISALSNPVKNLCYSIRSLTSNKTVNGVVIKVIKFIVTFDLVYAPGIAIAKKAFHPSVESIANYDAAIAADIISNMDTEARDKFSTESIWTPDDVLKELTRKAESSPIYTGL